MDKLTAAMSKTKLPHKGQLGMRHMLEVAWQEPVKICVHHRLYLVGTEIVLYRSGDPRLYLVGIADGEFDRHVGSVRQVADGWVTFGAFSLQAWPSMERAAVALASAYLGRVAVAIEAEGKLRAA
jgi:hypothetical protein